MPVAGEWCIAHVLGSGGQEVGPGWERKAHTVPCLLGCRPVAVDGRAQDSDELGCPEWLVLACILCKQTK